MVLLLILMPQVNTITITTAQIIDYKYGYLKNVIIIDYDYPGKLWDVLFLDIPIWSL